MIINHNMNALNAHRNMNVNNTNAGKSMEKLSSGLRINRAGDDAAGLAISEKMRGQIRGLEQSSRNASDGISMIQTAEGALNETTNILQRMRELAVQASNDTNTTSDREEIQKEINALTEEVDRIANNTEFNTQKLLNGNKSGEAGKIEISAEVAEQKGEFEVDLGGTVSANDMLIVDGKEIKLTGGNTPTEVQDALKGKYTVTLNGNKLKLTQVNAEDKDNMSVSFKGKNLQVKVKAGIEHVDAVFNEGTVNLQVGANAKQSMSIEIGDMRAEALGAADDQGQALSVKTSQDANKAIKAFDAALNAVSSQS